MKKKQKQLINQFTEKQSGITLISLVITIIILIILAGISISLILGENGLFTKAREATEKFSEAQKEEEKAITELEMEIRDNENLPENTQDTPAGTQVKLPNKWIEAEKISVRAIATGKGEEVPVPKGFYYVGGTIESGVVISDDQKDQNKYANYEPTGDVKEGIPAGVVYDTSTGIPKAESQLTDDEKQKVILGNQFVWIPVESANYKKETWTKEDETEYSNVTTWDKETPEKELTQIKKYGGFYIGRYEAGTSGITLLVDSQKVDFAAAHVTTNWRNEIFSIKYGKSIVTGKITSKAGEIPYYHADYFTALKLCNSMYETEYVQSSLATGTMWDAMLNFIAGSNKAIVTTDSYWGNYSKEDKEHVKYTEGQGRYAAVQTDSGSAGTNDAFKISDGSFHYGIKTTASTEDVKKKNLYDVAGNLWEWTQEESYLTSHIGQLKNYILRGSSAFNALSISPVCYRVSYTENVTDTTCGFRPALYIK